MTLYNFNQLLVIKFFDVASRKTINASSIFATVRLDNFYSDLGSDPKPEFYREKKHVINERLDIEESTKLQDGETEQAVLIYENREYPSLCVSSRVHLPALKSTLRYGVLYIQKNGLQHET